MCILHEDSSIDYLAQYYILGKIKCLEPTRNTTNTFHFVIVIHVIMWKYGLQKVDSLIKRKHRRADIEH